MASYQVLYWREIPAQIKAEDDSDVVNVPLDARFTQQIDELAMKLGLHLSDEYLSQWNWGEPIERPGSAQDVAAAVKAELEATHRS